jgi:S-layer homology domain
MHQKVLGRNKKMAHRNRFSSGLAAFMAMGITAGTVAPMVISAPSVAQTATTFTDVQSDYWASQFIQRLAQRGIIAGFPDGSFRPQAPVTRAQFAAMLNKAFQKNTIRQGTRFSDVRSNYWASTAIQQAYTTGFMSGYPGNRFGPEEQIPRQQVLVSLANGLEFSPQGNVESTLQAFNDSTDIAGYARSPIAAATENRIVVNYPNLKFLNPEQVATRAQVAAFIYQALASTNQVAAINSPYIVALNDVETPPVAVVIPQGTEIPVKYDKAEKILVTQDETAPLTLTVAQNVVTDKGAIVIPAGSQVVGQLKPVKGKKGSQFVADKLVTTNGQEYKLSAQSEIITKTQRIEKGSRLGSALKNAALGAGAAAAVSAVTGDRAIATEEVLGGAAIGGLIGAFFGRKSVDLIVIDPDTDLQMTIGQNLQISLR